MQLRYLKNLHAPVDGMSKVTSISWSSNTARLAVVGADKVVQLFDENGEKQDRFRTKPADSAARTYIVKTIAFSPDCTKLAVAQSDNIVFVYKLVGPDGADKKSISNKFAQSSSVTCLVWLLGQPNQVVFGLAEGKVKVGQLKSNKAAVVYSTDSFVVSMAAGPDGNSLVTGHLDGSIYRFLFETDQDPRPMMTKIAAIPSCVPYALSWGYAGIVAAGNDRCVRFWDPEGQEGQTFDCGSDPKMKEFTVAAFNPSGESVVLGNFNRFLVYAWHAKNREWTEVAQREVPNLYTVTALAWRADGSRLIVGSLCGGVDMFDVCIRRSRYRGTHEFTYISLSQVIVKSLASGARIVLKSNVGFEIKKINIYQERFLVAHTPESILLGDLETCRLSEIPWNSNGNEKIYFENPTVCMIFKAGELSLVEYGCNEVLACCRTEHMSPHLISVRIANPDDEMYNPNQGDMKVIAYLLDLLTIRVCDALSNQTLATITNDARIDWLELNPNGANKLLYRDKRHQLYLFDIESQSRTTLLNFCNYVQWVPGSDVVVAQSRGQLCVWYSINAPDRVTIHEIKGDIEEIERSNGRTCVIVDEGVNMVEYELDEGLISFGSCLERGLYAKAVDLLEELPLTLETEAMWRTLADTSMQNHNLPVAERCYAVLGDISKSRYLHKVNRMMQEHAAETGGDGSTYYMAQAKMAMLEKQFQRAEAILIDNNELDEALAMYQDMHKYNESIRLAERKNHPKVGHLKVTYLQWLLSTQQEEEAGKLQEEEGDYVRAIELYLRAGMAAKAASVVQRRSANYSQELLQKIAGALQGGGMNDKAGELYERMGLINQAMDAYRRGHAFKQAIELAKQAQPALVVALEEEWGDWLVSQRNVDAAINHYIEAGSSTKAIDAAMQARQWHKAEQLLDQASVGMAPEFAMPLYEKLAAHYASSRHYDQAERAFIKSSRPQRAVQMYIEANQHEKAHRVAKAHMSPQERTELYSGLAQNLETGGKFSEAEQLYVLVGEFDLAINMYKKREEYEQMLRLVSKYRKELLTDTYKHIAEQFEMKGNLKKAEHYYVEAKMWQSAMSMYRQLEKWEDAKRVAKTHGGKAAHDKLVLAEAHATFQERGAEAGAQLLAKHGLIEVAIDYAVEHQNFQHAFELANQSAKHKLPDIHLKKALALEDDENFKLAEEEFIQANKPKEAIDMYVHQRDWVSAMRVAETYDREGVKDVMVHQAKDLVDQNNLAGAENLFVQAGKPELAVQAYSSKRQVNDAVRVCKKHCPHMLGDVVDAYSGADGEARSTPQTLEEILDAAKIYEDTGNFSRAMDTYLQVTESITSNQDRLEEVWENAVRLAMKHAPDRYNEVVGAVGQRLKSIARFEAAAELYESIEAVQEAINCYISGQVWDKARLLAQQHAPRMVQVVEERYKAHLVGVGDGDELIRKTGDVDSALDMYARKDDWTKCLALAEKHSPKMLPHYLIQYCKILANKGEITQACQSLIRYGVPPEQENFKLYRLVVEELLDGANATGPQMLREMLMRLVSQSSGGTPPIPKALVEDRSPRTSEFIKPLFAAHLMTVRGRLREVQKCPEVIAKISVSLCRYCTELPVDQAFFDAGIDCKNANMVNMAFLFLNRFLDIADAIEDPENATIDNVDFKDTDIPEPDNLELPEEGRVDATQIEEIRDKVLAWSMDQSIQQQMDTRQCDVPSCRADIYVASLVCPKCAQRDGIMDFRSPNANVQRYDPCVVTGYPVSKRTRIECTSCRAGANRDDWNAWVQLFKCCPWCGQPQNPKY